MRVASDGRCRTGLTATSRTSTSRTGLSAPPVPTLFRLHFGPPAGTTCTSRTAITFMFRTSISRTGAAQPVAYVVMVYIVMASRNPISHSGAAQPVAYVVIVYTVMAFRNPISHSGADQVLNSVTTMIAAPFDIFRAGKKTFRFWAITVSFGRMVTANVEGTLVMAY